jgi:LPXTG-site transpeptidase (sortase) family protein
VNLSRVTTVLLVAIISINAYTIALPVMPAVQFWYTSHHTDTVSRLQQALHSAGTQSDKTARTADNRIVIPAMQLDQPIYAGADARTLSKGLWLRPTGSTPDKQSNTVIAGHRFTYTNPRGTFYLLDRVKPGDEVGVFWHGKKYLYRVNTTRVVPATATEIEAPSKTAELTLYTCTPLWNPKDRLVVTATLEEAHP